MARDMKAPPHSRYNLDRPTLEQVKRWIDEAPGPEHESYYYVLDKVESFLGDSPKQTNPEYLTSKNLAIKLLQMPDVKVILMVEDSDGSYHVQEAVAVWYQTIANQATIRADRKEWKRQRPSHSSSKSKEKRNGK